jgi:hypothetical protein
VECGVQRGNLLPEKASDCIKAYNLYTRIALSNILHVSNSCGGNGLRIFNVVTSQETTDCIE